MYETQREGETCSTAEDTTIRQRLCPDCGMPLQEGPHGGLSVNWFCIGSACGSRFNVMGVLGTQRISPACPKAGR
jgi:hypothetical protein